MANVDAPVSCCDSGDCGLPIGLVSGLNATLKQRRSIVEPSKRNCNGWNDSCVGQRPRNMETEGFLLLLDTEMRSVVSREDAGSDCSVPDIVLDMCQYV